MSFYAYEKVLEHIREMLEEEDFKEGERLPSERSMAERFSVSRHAVRQALQSLAERGFLERRQGSGSTIVFGKELMLEKMNQLLHSRNSRLEDLFEFRLIFEPEIAALAAGRIEEKTLERLELLLLKQESARNFSRIDASFHRLIAEATANSILIELFSSLSRVLNEGRGPDLISPQRLAFSLKAHTRIFNALKKRDSEAARKAMYDHIHDLREILFLKKDKFF